MSKMIINLQPTMDKIYFMEQKYVYLINKYFHYSSYHKEVRYS